MEARSQAAGEIIGYRRWSRQMATYRAKDVLLDSMDRLATSALDALDELYEHGVWLQSQMDHVADASELSSLQGRAECAI